MGEQTAEKTEEPTDKKIKDARKKGQVAKSTDVSSTGLLIVLFAYFAIFKGYYLKQMQAMLLAPTIFYDVPFKEAMIEVMKEEMTLFLMMVVPLLGVVAVFATAINFIQVGPLLTFEPIKPDVKKLNPVEGAKKIFSKKNLIELLKSIIKMVFLGYLIYRVVRSVIDPLFKIPFSGLNAIFEVIGPILKTFAINVLVAYIIIAVADLFFQRKQHRKDLRMTKDEVKREFKEMEGDPLIKSERKQLYQEMAQNDTVQATKQSSVLVTNPTHIAIAIFYVEGVVKLPVVTAKGTDATAEMMIKVAKENNIPIMQNIPLAHDLYGQVPEVYNYIPSDLIEPVAAVLRWAKEIQGQ